MENLLREADLYVYNRNTTMRTYHNEQGQGDNIDVTLGTVLTNAVVRGWELKDWTLSDHRVVVIAIGRQTTNRPTVRPTIQRQDRNGNQTRTHITSVLLTDPAEHEKLERVTNILKRRDKELR